MTIDRLAPPPVAAISNSFTSYIDQSLISIVIMRKKRTETTTLTIYNHGIIAFHHI